MYSAMADIAALTGDQAYIAALNKLWENVVNKKIYITGGIGSGSHGEAFGKDYEIPNLPPITKHAPQLPTRSESPHVSSP